PVRPGVGRTEEEDQGEGEEEEPPSVRHEPAPGRSLLAPGARLECGALAPLLFHFFTQKKTKAPLQRRTPKRPAQALLTRHSFLALLCSTLSLTLTALPPTTRAAFSATLLASSPLGSQPAAMETILPPFSMRKLVGMVLVWKVVQLAPLGSTA